MKRRVRRYADGGEVGYEENPQPGVQSDREPSRKKPTKKGAESRKISSMEFIRKYEDSPASSRIKEEAASEAKKSREDETQGSRYSGTYGETREALSSLSPEEKKLALKFGIEGAAGMGLGRALGAVSEANIPLRIKQLLRRRETARINEMERAADKAGEAARRGMSRRNSPSYSERYRAGEDVADWRAAHAKDLPEGLKFKRGGAVKSSASRRADGIAKKGKTRGRMI